ncbi:MAG: hypothetical protein ACOX6N_02745 [Patescibacteria group bacterium]|jgi:ABC-type multidrug transport system fused ATPase/permease subunit
MTRETREIIRFILKLVCHKNSFFFWVLIRFISALFPMLSIYLYSRVIKYLETGASLDQIYLLITAIISVFIFDNLSRLLSIHSLNSIISQTELGIHQFMIIGLKTYNKKIRHEVVQAIRNFGEAVRTTLELIRQPGIDAVVSFAVVPTILLFIDIRIFILEIAYIVTYYFVDVYTTEKYTKLKDVQNQKTEVYYAKLQDSNRIKKESLEFTNHFKKLCRWGFVEWFSLQNIAVSFYTIILFYLIHQVQSDQKQISDLVLIMGYVTSTQVFLNNLSSVKDRLADTKVALSRLADSKYLMSVGLNDFMR